MAYGKFMDQAKGEYNLPWTDRMVGKGAQRRLITFDLAKTRPNGFLKHWAAFIRVCGTVFMPAYDAFLKKNKSNPSGTNDEDAKKFIK